MRFDVFTLLPEIFEPYLGSSILQRARQNGLVEVWIHNIRDWTYDKHHITDDEPFGGGGGMVMKPEPIFRAVEEVLGSPPACPLILLTPQGRVFTQQVAIELAQPALAAARLTSIPLPEAGRGEIVEHAMIAPDSQADAQDFFEPELPPGAVPRLALLCGRYEGVDERVRRYLVTDEISIGDYVITGGELAALIVIDAVSRLIPGVLGDPDGAWEDSHASGLLEYPHYTRPAEFRGWRVPDVLVSGDHAKVARWRREQALLRTWQRRPDLLENAPLTEADRKFLASIQ